MDNLKQIHYTFSGSVQGVGFRYTADRMARSFRIKGWVKNLSNGKVELVAQGLPKNIVMFIHGLKMDFAISSIDQYEEPLARFDCFSVK